jgi:hypothetical protein
VSSSDFVVMTTSVAEAGREVMGRMTHLYRSLPARLRVR